MANNKRKDLGIGNFIEEVKADSTSSQRKPSPAADIVLPAEQQEPLTAAYQPVGRPARKQTLLSKKLAKLVCDRCDQLSYSFSYHHYSPLRKALQKM